MADFNNWDSMEMFLLKECYDLAGRYAPLDGAREVLREKSGQIDLPENYVPAQADVVFPQTEMQVISEAMFGLTLAGYTASGGDDFNNTYKVNALPQSAEKEYFLALMALRNGMNESQRTEALRHLSIALAEAPNDPRYIALQYILIDA